MTITYLTPVALSLLLLAAHFLRSGNLVLVVVALALACLLGVRRAWAGRVVQWALVVGALEWLRTLTVLVDERRLAGLPYTRLALILGGVGALAIASAAIMTTAQVTNHFARRAASSRRE